MVGNESGSSAVVGTSTLSDDPLASSETPPLRLTLVKSGKKSANSKEEWELYAHESCIACSSDVTLQKSDSWIQLQLAPSGGSDDIDALHDRRYVYKKQLKHVFHDTEAISFINLSGALEAIEFIGPVDLRGSVGNSMLILASCRSSTHGAPSCNSIQAYQLLVEPLVGSDETTSDGDIPVKIYKPQLLLTCSLKDQVCMGINWLNGESFARTAKPVDNRDQLVLLHMECGTIMLCKLKIGALEDVHDASSLEGSNMYDMFDVLWKYDPSKIISEQMITCTSVSYCTEPVHTSQNSSAETTAPNIASSTSSQDEHLANDSRCIIMIAGGTNDGFLLVWKFSWDDLCNANGHISNYNATNAVSPFFHKMIPVLLPHQDASIVRRLVSINFLPFPESQIVAIAAYTGVIIIWDIRHGCLEGEISTYSNIHRPPSVVRWTHDLQYLVIGGTSAMCVEWQRKSALTTLSYDRWPRVKYEGVFDNVCWDIDSTEKYINFCYDDGLFVQVPVLALSRRDANELGTTYLWEPASKDGHDQVPDESDLTSTDVVSKVEELSSMQFSMDLEFIRQHGICITRNGSQYRGGRVGKKRDSRLIRNKVMAHHCMRALTAKFNDFTLSFVAYGGNAGLLQLLIKN